MLQRCGDLARAGRRGREAGARPYSQTGPNHCTMAASIVETPSHRSCCLCPPMLPPITSSTAIVVGGCACHPLERLAACGCNWVRSPLPLPSFRWALESPLFPAMYHTLCPRLSYPIALFAPTAHGRSRHIMQTGSNWSLANKYKPRTSSRTRDGLMWSNGGSRRGTYLDMIVSSTKKTLKGKRKGERTFVKGYHNGILPNSRTLKGQDGPAASFKIFQTFFYPFFTILVKTGKKAPKICLNVKGRNACVSRSTFYPSFYCTCLSGCADELKRYFVLMFHQPIAHCTPGFSTYQESL